MCDLNASWQQTGWHDYLTDRSVSVRSAPLTGKAVLNNHTGSNPVHLKSTEFLLHALTSGTSCVQAPSTNREVYPLPASALQPRRQTGAAGSCHGAQN